MFFFLPQSDGLVVGFLYSIDWRMVSLKLIIHVIHWNDIPAHLAIRPTYIHPSCHVQYLAPTLFCSCPVLAGLRVKECGHQSELHFFQDKHDGPRPWECNGIVSCWNQQAFVPCCPAENPQNCKNMYCRVFSVLGIGLSGLECWVSLTKERWVHVQQDIPFPSSLFFTHAWKWSGKCFTNRTWRVFIRTQKHQVSCERHVPAGAC